MNLYFVWSVLKPSSLLFRKLVSDGSYFWAQQLFELFVWFCLILSISYYVNSKSEFCFVHKYHYSEIRKVAWCYSSTQKWVGCRTHKCNSQMLILLSCQVTTFLWQRMARRWVCLLCERICIYIIRSSLPSPELSVFHFMVQERLATLQRHFILLFQQKQYLLLLQRRLTVSCE